jgi:hypothetical protein
MSTSVDNITEAHQVFSHKGSLLLRTLLVLLFVVLIADLTPGLRIGISSGLSGKNILLYIVVIAIAIRAATGSRGIRFSDLDVHMPFLLLIAYATITIIIVSAFSPTYSILRATITLKNQLIDLYLFMFVFRYGLDRREDYLRILRFVVVTLLILSFLTLIDFLNVPDLGIIGLHDGRIEGPFGSANQYGALLAFLIPMSIATISPNLRRWRKRLWWLGIIITGALLLATGSRGALVSIVVGSTIGVYLLRRYLNMRQVAKYATIAFGLFAVFVILFLIFNADLLMGRIEKTTSGNIYVATAGRFGIWSAALKVMLEWPMSFLVGNGWNAFESSGIWKSAHNEYLDRTYELGAIGLALFVWLLYTITTRARRRLSTADPELRKILIGYVFSMSIVVVNITFSGLPDPWTVIWIVTGIIMGLQATATSEYRVVDPTNDATVSSGMGFETGGSSAPVVSSRVDAGK